MAARNDVEGFSRSEWTFWEVLDSVLEVINRDHSSETVVQPMVEPAIKYLVHNSSILLGKWKVVLEKACN